jgi:hypothetical protein
MGNADESEKETDCVIKSEIDWRWERGCMCDSSGFIESLNADHFQSMKDCANEFDSKYRTDSLTDLERLTLAVSAKPEETNSSYRVGGCSLPESENTTDGKCNTESVTKPVIEYLAEPRCEFDKSRCCELGNPDEVTNGDD